MTDQYVMIDTDTTDFSRFLMVTGLDQYYRYECFSLAGVDSLTTLFALTHEDLNDLTVEMNMSGDESGTIFLNCRS